MVLSSNFSLSQQLQLSRELARLIRARLPLENALNELARQSAGSQKQAAAALSERLAAGHSLSESLASGSRQTSRMLAGAVDIGQASGSLDKALESWTHLHANLGRKRRRLFVAAVYPTLLLIVMVVSLSVTAGRLIPLYDEAFTSYVTEKPAWLKFLSFIHQYLPYFITVFVVVAVMPIATWWLRRQGVTRAGVRRELAARCYMESYIAQLASLLVHSGRPVGQMIGWLEQAAGFARSEGSPNVETAASPNVETAADHGLTRSMFVSDSTIQARLGRETVLALASLDAGIVTPQQCETLLQGIASQVGAQADAHAEMTARWLPVLVALIVGVAGTLAYVGLLYGPWLALFRQIAAPVTQ